MTWAALLEVKYRGTFDVEAARELHATLSRQREYWPESHAVLMISQPFVDNGKFHQDYIRVIPADRTDLLVSEIPALIGETERDRMGAASGIDSRCSRISSVIFPDRSPTHSHRLGRKTFGGAPTISRPLFATWRISDANDSQCVSVGEAVRSSCRAPHAAPVRPNSDSTAMPSILIGRGPPGLSTGHTTTKAPTNQRRPYPSEPERETSA